MSPEDFKACRQSCGLSPFDWGRALGYTGERHNIRIQINRYETGRRVIPPWIARLAFMFARHGVPEDLPAIADE